MEEVKNIEKTERKKGKTEREEGMLEGEDDKVEEDQCLLCQSAVGI